MELCYKTLLGIILHPGVISRFPLHLPRTGFVEYPTCINAFSYHPISNVKQ